MTSNASQAYCFACFNTSLTLINGVLVCDACGTQTEVHVEEEDENFDQQRRFGGRRILTQTDGPQTQNIFQLQYADTASEQAQVQGMALTYVKCLQCMLQAQADTMVQRFGMPVDLASLVRQLWLSYVPRTGILDIQLEQIVLSQADIARQKRQQRQGAASAPAMETEDAGGVPSASADAAAGGAAAAGDGSRNGGDGEEPSKLLAGQATNPQRIYLAFKRVLHPNSSLLICYLACLVLRQPVSPLDVCRWALQGHLPYLDMPTRCQSLLQAVPETWRPPMQLLSLAGCPEPQALTEGVQKLASSLQVPLPNVNGELLLLKCCKELHAPEDIFLIARELYVMYFLDSHLMNLSGQTSSGEAVTSSPYVSVVALVCMAMKLAYGIGSHPSLGSRLPGLPDPPDSWVDWAEACMSSPACKPLHMPGSIEQAQNLRGPALLQYLAFCQEHVFAGNTCPEPLLGMQRLMQSVLKRQQGSKGRDGHREDEQDLPPRQQGSEAPLLVSDAASRHLTPTACKPIYTYAKFVHAAGSAQVPADIAALLAVAAAYANTSLSSVMLTLTALESTMVKAEAAYKLKREELQVALGTPLLQHADGKDAERLKVCASGAAAAQGQQPSSTGAQKRKAPGPRQA